MDVVRRLAGELGIGHAEIVLVNSGDCCNFHVGLRHCYAMVRSGQYRNVLFVTTDRVDDAFQGQHVAVRGAGVNSDAAASGLVSDQVRNGFRLCGHFEQIRDTHLLSPDYRSDDDFVKVLGLARRVAKGLYAHHGWQPADFAKLITNTYTLAVTELLAMSAQFPLEAVFTANIARTAHCFAADNVINLLDFAVQEVLPAGTRVMLLGSGVHQWAATAVEIGEEPIRPIR
jgi:3-oxoacyl-[acyl-carrier-protein] synthase-3